MPDPYQPLSLSRREFLRSLSALSGAVALTAALRAVWAAPNTPAPLHVIIVGAGLADLCAAYELERRGHRVTMLKADTRHVGGRVRILRFADGLYGEAGASAGTSGRVAGDTRGATRAVEKAVRISYTFIRLRPQFL